MPTTCIQGLVMNFCLLTIYNVTTLYYKIHPLPAKNKKIKKKLPRISEFVNFLKSIDWSLSTVVLRVVRGQQFMTIPSASAAQHALLCCIWMNWTTNLTNFYMNYRCLSGQKQRLVTYATDIWRTFHYCPNSRQRQNALSVFLSLFFRHFQREVQQAT